MYYLHQVDRDYALSRIAEGEPGDREAGVPPLTHFALRHRAAEWFVLSRKPREAWRTLADLSAQLSEFELRYEGKDYDTAAAVLLEFDYDYLHLWGHYRLMTELHERLQGKLTDPDLARSSLGNLGNAYYRMGQLQRAMSCYDQALHLARESNDRWGEGVWIGNLGNCIADLGENARAIEYYKQALGIRREVGDRRGESLDLGNLANQYDETGQFALAIEHYQQALAIDREIADRENEAHDLCNLGDSYMSLGQVVEAVRCYKDAVDIARDTGYRLVEARAHGNMAELHLFQGSWAAAARELEQAIEIADDIGSSQYQKTARNSLALVNLQRGDLARARDMAEAAGKYDLPLSNHQTSAVLGIVALRQGDLSVAREAFSTALDQAEQLLAVTPNRYAALETKALALCGLALCGSPVMIPTAKAAYEAARVVTSQAGVVDGVLQLFDALSLADRGGILAEVRPVAAGTGSE